MNKNDNSNLVVLYHANCLDGFAAAYAAWKKFGNSASYIAVNYGKDLPAGLEGKYVLIVDFSYHTDKLEELCKVAKHVTVLDHHKTALPELQAVNVGNYNYTWELEKSGAVISWEYFHQEPVPQLLLHIQDRDIWQWRLAGTKEICAAPFSKKLVERSFNYWDFLVNAYETNDTEVMHGVYSKGRAIIARNADLVEECMANAGEPIVDNYGFKVIKCNAPASIASELGNAIAEKYPDCIAVISTHSFKTNTTKYSLRSTGDIDCTKLAKIFGGGGHKNAAGFSIKHD